MRVSGIAPTRIETGRNVSRETATSWPGAIRIQYVDAVRPTTFAFPERRASRYPPHEAREAGRDRNPCPNDHIRPRWCLVTAMIVTGVDFVSIPTQDLERAVAFYGDTLGLERSVHRPEHGFAEFETGTVT